MTNLIVKYLMLFVFLLVSWAFIEQGLILMGLDNSTNIPIGMAYGFAIGWNWERITDWLSKRLAKDK